MIVFRCRYCNKRHECAPNFAGGTLRCSGCKNTLRIPGKTESEKAVDLGLALVFFLSGLMFLMCGGCLSLYSLGNDRPGAVGGVVMGVGMVLFGVLVMFMTVVLEFLKGYRR
ncbi:MAG TPA: hypothetical protein VH643_10085 [Gemmataceae bacterium]|jgi:hypothetical protein